jgi:multiple sugar transport system permease protein
MTPRRISRDWLGYGFLLPYLALFVVFLILPLLFGLGLSFFRYEMLSKEPAKFVGIDNYAEALWAPHSDGTHGDAYFRQALWATVRFVAMASPLTVTIALLIALGISVVPERRQSIYRLLVFVPTMITISVAGILWRWFLTDQFGLFNTLLARLGFSEIHFLSETRLAMRSIVLMTLWWTLGGPVVVLLAGIKQIPDAYYEAASIDGATGWRRCWHITLPLLKPVLLFVVVLNIIGAWQVFGQPFIVTAGGPERSTLVLMQYIYATSFLSYRLGYGAAMSWILFLLIAAFSILQFRLLREK